MDCCNLDVNENNCFNQLVAKLAQQARVTVNYFAMPPTTFGAICKGLGVAGLNNKSRLVVMEKLIGTDLNSAKMINDQVAEYFTEIQVSRIDHYLG